MIDHFSIAVPQNSYSEIERVLVHEAERDPSIVIIRRDKTGLALAFSVSSESADIERHRLRQAGSISPSVCILVLNQYGIQVSQECSDASRERMSVFVKAILTSFPSVRVHNDDTQDDITNAVQSDPNILFN